MITGVTGGTRPARSAAPRQRSNAGFTLIEVLVTVSIVGTALAGLLGVVRTQIRAVDALRCHSEARLLLQEAFDRYQFGDGAAGDSSVVGRHGTYELFTQSDIAQGSNEILPSDGTWRKECIGVRWKQGGQEHSLVWAAWR